MKKKVLLLIISAMVCLCACGENTGSASSSDNTTASKAAETTSAEGIKISNSLFEITLPADFEGIYDTDISDDQITVYHKQSKDDGFGGMAFSVWARQLPAEFAGGPYTKVGELTDENGKRYEVVLGYATEIQWDYEAEEPDDFERLYESAEDVVKTITGVNGATYAYQAGTKGEDLYGEIVEKYKTAVSEGWDAQQFEDNNMSAEFANIASTDGADGIGIAYYDINKDGIDECFVGTIKEDELKGTSYDIYTMVDDTPSLVVRGSARDRYYAYSDFIVNEYSGGAAEYGKLIYFISENTTELIYQWGTKYDAYENENQPWFISYDEDEWENVSEDDCLKREAPNEEYVKLDFKPLSQI